MITNSLQVTTLEVIFATLMLPLATIPPLIKRRLFKDKSPQITAEDPIKTFPFNETSFPTDNLLFIDTSP